MAIQVRRGNISDLDKGKLLPGEYACAMDKKRVFLQFGTTQETVLEMPTKENYEDMLKEVADSAKEAQDAAEEAKTATNKVQGLIEHEEDVRGQIQELSNEARSSADEALQHKIDSEQNASISAGYADSAAQSATTAEESKAAAEQSALNAKASEEAAAESAESANQNALLAESYFHGGTGIREGEDEENVKALYEKIQAVADLDIATETKAGLVKAGEDVHVAADGTMNIPKLTELESLIKGASSAKVCEDLEDMVTLLNNASLAEFTVGTNILIKAVGVPDFWISEVYTERLTFVFVSDEDLVSRVNLSDGTLQTGYYGISFLETDKVDLTGIAKESYVNAKFDEAAAHSDANLETATEYTDKKITSAANNQQPTFSQAASRENIVSGEKMSVILGKIRKWFSDLKAVAFTGSYNDLANKPAIPNAVRVKGDSETAYRIGDVNLTPENIGALSLNGNAKSATKAVQDENGNNIVSTYLKKHGNEVLDAEWATDIRTKLKGSNEYSGYISRFRVNVPVEKLWQFGSTLVVGCGDTQFYLNVPYFKRNPWIGGGAREHIDWEEQLAFLSDLNQLKEDIGNSTVKQYTIQFAQGSAGTFTSEISMADKGFSQPPVVNFRGTNGNAGYYFDILDCTVNRVLVRVERRFGSGNDSDAFIAYIIGI